jgi:hypothetical protein
VLDLFHRISYRLTLSLLLATLAACTPTASQTLNSATQTSDVVVVNLVPTTDGTSVAQAVTRTPGPILLASPDASNAAASIQAPTSSVPLEPDAIVASAEGIVLRTGPGLAFDVAYGPIAANTPLKFTAVSPDMLWLEVETSIGEHGWAELSLLTIYSALSDLPVVDVPVPTQSIVENVQLTIVPSLSPEDVAPPTVATADTGPISNHVREIFALGQQLGNDPHVFIKVGDSTTEQQAFMIGFGTGEYNLGAYTDLQASIDYFSHDAFTRDSFASESAFNSASVLDSFRVPEEGKEICQPGEKPLECEIRVMKPAFAFILFGGNEVRSSDMDLDVYSNQIQQVIEVSTTRGVIPILTTFPHAPDFHENAAAYNEELRRIAFDRQIPLIDLEVAVLPLPNGGVSEEDGFHMSMRGVRGDVTDNWIYLNGEEKQYGATLRNLLTLQMLDLLRRELALQ